MARALYGCTSADFTLTAGGRLSPGAVLTLWTARTGGTRITDLLTVDGTPITEVVSGADASIAYQGPDNDKSVHWADSGQGARTAIRPVDITGEPNSLSVGTVTTGAAGSSAAVTITGDAPSQTMNLTIPQGATGLAGASVGVLTTKGDLLVRDSGAGVRLPVGADNRVLTADASQAAGMRWATPTTRVGTGSPLGIVVPDFKGQKFCDTEQTLGAREWVATGTTASSWVVSDGDTGWLDVVVWDAAGTITKGAFGSEDWGPHSGDAGYIKVRRTPEAVSLRILQAVSLKDTNTSAIVFLPVGFRSDVNPCLVAFPLTQSSMSLTVYSFGLVCPLTGAASGEVLGPYSWATVSFHPLASPPWPTAAPV